MLEKPCLCLHSPLQASLLSYSNNVGNIPRCLKKIIFVHRKLNHRGFGLKIKSVCYERESKNWSECEYKKLKITQVIILGRDFYLRMSALSFMFPDFPQCENNQSWIRWYLQANFWKSCMNDLKGFSAIKDKQASNPTVLR